MDSEERRIEKASLVWLRTVAYQDEAAESALVEAVLNAFADVFFGRVSGRNAMVNMSKGSRTPPEIMSGTQRLYASMSVPEMAGPPTPASTAPRDIQTNAAALCAIC
jgi:hypothetical protein